MQAAIATAVVEPLAFAEREVPVPGQGEILVKITACGVCHTDLDLVQGRWPIARFPVVPGHEISGVVEATGPGVSWPAAGASVGRHHGHGPHGQAVRRRLRLTVIGRPAARPPGRRGGAQPERTAGHRVPSTGSSPRSAKTSLATLVALIARGKPQ
jgi:NADPH:quinone reductase-like Zn-dependent oxidoreductase